MKKYRKTIFLTGKLFIFVVFSAIAAAVLYGCGPKVAIRQDYNFGDIKRIGVLKFDSSQIQFVYNDPGNAVADEFVF